MKASLRHVGGVIAKSPIPHIEKAQGTAVIRGSLVLARYKTCTASMLIEDQDLH
jgi:hypothetical protein